MKGAKLFNKMDIIWGYNNVRIKEGDEWKAAFLTPRGLFEPKVMFFGLCNSPGTFSRMMASLFRDQIRRRIFIVYMDDIIVTGSTKQELEKNTQEILKVLSDNKLYIKESKCLWEVQECPILGYVVGNGKIQMEEEKIEAIKNWKTPRSKKEIQKFLGFANFYRQFVKDYSKITKPLTSLTGSTPFEWGQAQQGAFEGLIERITSKPVLALPQPKGQFRVKTDASGYAIGAVLSQKQDDKWHPIAFLSRCMTAAEHNYEIYDKELLAIVVALKAWRQYLLEAREPFEVLTDHKNLAYFRKPQRLNMRQAGWYLKLQDYDYTLRHIPGTTNTKADILSRLPWYPEEIEKQEDVQMLNIRKKGLGI